MKEPPGGAQPPLALPVCMTSEAASEDTEREKCKSSRRLPGFARSFPFRT